jgi:hypothetical protein
MKNITEKFNDRLSISQMIAQQEMEANLDESLRDVFDVVKTKFKQVWQWVRGLVVRVGTYVLPVSNDGEVQPAITPMTAGVAYKEGLAKDPFTLIYNSKDASKISGLKTNPKEALALLGGDNKADTFNYWESLYEAEVDPNKANVNEVKMHTEDPEAKWNIINDDAELRDEITRHIKKAKLARLLIWGAPGIGKTAILNAVVDGFRKAGNDYNLIVKTLSNETPDNFMLPKYVEVGEGNVKAEDVPKTWLPVYHPTGDPAKDAQLDAALGKGMLFIDELSRATQQVLNVCLPLINEGQFNGWQMGSGWCIVCASNRPEDEDSGQAPIGKSLLNRFSHIYYEPTVHTWRKWADKQGFMSPLLLQWLSLPETENMSGGKYYYMDPNEDIQSASSTALMCTPRAWTNAMRDLASYSHTGELQGFTIFDIPNNIIGRVLNKYVPSSAVDSFIAFLSVIHSIGDFDRVTADIWKNGGKSVKISAKDLMKIALPLAQLIITSHADSLPNDKEFENLATWLADQKNDQLASYVLDIFKSTFMGDIKDTVTRDKLFVLHGIKDYIAKQPDHDEKKRLYDAVFKPFFDRWNVDWDSAPDYQKGLQVAGKAYGDTFRNAIVDGQEALG